MEKRTLSIQEAADAAGVSLRHAYSLAERGELPGAIKLGGRWVVVKRVFMAMLGEPVTG